VNLAILTYGLTAVLMLAALPLLLSATRGHWRRRFLGWALVLQSLWAAVIAARTSQVVLSDWLLMAVDALRYGALLCLLVTLSTLPLRAWVARSALALCVGVLLLAGVAQLLASYAGWSEDLSHLPGLGALLLTVSGLVLIEQVVRNSPIAGGSGLKLCALAIGGMFTCDLFVAAQATLSTDQQTVLLVARGVVYLLLLPCLWLGIKNLEGQPSRAFVSRQVVFYGTAAVAVGLYLVMASLAAWLLQVRGGSWAQPLRVLLLLGALAVLGVVLLSESPSRRLKVFIAKHFYSNKYDYRVEWLRFIATLSQPYSNGEDARHTAIRAIAQIFNSPGGVLYQSDSIGQPLLPVASWSASRVPMAPLQPLEPHEQLPAFLAASQWVIDLHEYVRYPERYRHIALPEQLLEPDGNWRMLVPLLEPDRLNGFLVLQSPPPPFDMTYEDRDLLKTVGRHVAVLLAQQQADHKLSENRQFDAFNRFAAFVMHDMKNSVAQLQLLVANAARHRHNPQFMDDAIDTIANTVGRMTRLISQLQARDAQSAERQVDAVGLLRAAVARALPREPSPTLQCVTPALAVSGDPDRLAAVFDHLIRNAQDAAGPSGQVAVALTLTVDHWYVRVTDTGPGMDAQFVRERLFKPFDSTKGSKGMGIGAYQARAYVQQLCGSLEVQTSPGQGTVMVIRVPL
jgi:putative PEP-CTERM system histidine kinase